jgi:hypothetical protein
MIAPTVSQRLTVVARARLRRGIMCIDLTY